MRPFAQLIYLWADLNRIINHKWWRLYSALFSPVFLAILGYRISRCLYLLLGRGWIAIRLILSPVFLLLYPWFGKFEIHYRADIGPGLAILHSSFGVTISAATCTGSNLTLIGGNCIGRKDQSGPVIIGNNVTLGVHANILGPVKIGNNVTVGMSALVIHDAGDNEILVGVPAKAIQKSNDFPASVQHYNL